MKLAALFYLRITYIKTGLFSFLAKFGWRGAVARIKINMSPDGTSVPTLTGLQGADRRRRARAHHRPVPGEVRSALPGEASVRPTVNNASNSLPDSQDDRLSLCSNVKTKTKLLCGHQATEGRRQGPKFSLARG